MAEEKEKWRANYVPAPGFYNLNQACVVINKAFGKNNFGCYLVGSSLKRRDYRDVDVRMIMSDGCYDAMFKNEHGYTNALWSLMCTTISAWLSTQSGLPIDFQIQRQSSANRDHSQKTGHPRQPLGIFNDYPGERPTATKQCEYTSRKGEPCYGNLVEAGSPSGPLYYCQGHTQEGDYKPDERKWGVWCVSTLTAHDASGSPPGWWCTLPSEERGAPPDTKESLDAWVASLNKREAGPWHYEVRPAPAKTG